jgi:Fe-S cluster assembly iron-binding protein IscA
MSLTVTPGAAHRLETTLARVREEPDQVFRLVEHPSGGYGMELDKPEPGDIVIRHNQVAVLVLEETIAEALTGAALDVGQEPGEPEWVLAQRGSTLH